jgi:hypothetical protein
LRLSVMTWITTAKEKAARQALRMATFIRT